MDITSKLRHDAGFRRILMRKLQKLSHLEKVSTGHMAAEEEKAKLLIDVLRMCNFNAGLLAPYYYPRFSEEGLPLSMMDRPFSMAFFDLQMGGMLVTRAGRQVGKSTTLIARQRIYADILSNFHSMYVTPHTNYLDQYANRFRSMEKLFRFPVTDVKNYKQNKFYKEYPKNNTVKLFRVYESADPLRGHSGSEMIIDEAQNFDPSFEAVIDQCLKVYRLRARYFAGTSLTTDTFLETKYQNGSRATWHIPTTDNTGKRVWVNCGDEETVVKCIKPEGLICPYTGKPLRVETGEFVHEDAHAYNSGLASYHVPQIIVPELSTSSLSTWLEIWELFNKDIVKFMQEVMGIPKEEGYREITLEDLKRMCCLPDTLQGLEAKARKGYYRFIISGLDWGGSDYNPVEKTKVSTTVHAILGVTPDKNIDILHMFRYGGMKYYEIAKTIADNHKRFRGTIMVSDDGAGDLYNNYLQESGYIRPDKHLVLRYTAPHTKLFGRVQSDGEKFLNHYAVNRTEAISSLFAAIKREPSPRIRCYSWQQAQHMLEDFLHIYRNLIETESGAQKFRYRRHGSKKDDTLHAINFAYVAARVLLNEPLIDDRRLNDTLRHLLMGAGPGRGQNPYAGVSG